MEPTLRAELLGFLLDQFLVDLGKVMGYFLVARPHPLYLLEDIRRLIVDFLLVQTDALFIHLGQTFIKFLLDLLALALQFFLPLLDQLFDFPLFLFLKFRQRFQITGLDLGYVHIVQGLVNRGRAVRRRFYFFCRRIRRLLGLRQLLQTLLFFFTRLGKLALLSLNPFFNLFQLALLFDRQLILFLTAEIGLGEDAVFLLYAFLLQTLQNTLPALLEIPFPTPLFPRREPAVRKQLIEFVDLKLCLGLFIGGQQVEGLLTGLSQVVLNLGQEFFLGLPFLTLTALLLFLRPEFFFLPGVSLLRLQSFLVRALGFQHFPVNVRVTVTGQLFLFCPGSPVQPGELFVLLLRFTLFLDQLAVIGRILGVSLTLSDGTGGGEVGFFCDAAGNSPAPESWGPDTLTSD